MADDSERQIRAQARVLERVARFDPELHVLLSAEHADAGATEGTPLTEAMALPPGAGPGIALETIVRKGRPALYITNDRMRAETPLDDPVSAFIVARAMQARAVIEPLLPLIGRIDVVNHPAGYPYVGTGWVIQPGLLCTNRHVAELIGRQDGASYVFTRGQLGRQLEVGFNPHHEFQVDPVPGESFNITGIAWIEPEGGPDLALLRVNMTSDGTRPVRLELAADNGQSGQQVITIGYPARAYADTIPDQEEMVRIYGQIYDIKRAAPGMLDEPSNGSTTYDCTTLGGASGSPVLDLATGKVLALHFAGLYKVENYGVPASVLARYAAGVPTITAQPAGGTEGPVATSQPAANIVIPAGSTSASITVPLTITVSLGAPGGPAASTIEAAVAQLAAEARAGVLAVKSGFDGRRDCLVVAANPPDATRLRAELPPSYAGFPLEVRFATIEEQLGLDLSRAEAPAVIAYDDTRRTGPDFSFDEVDDDDISVIAHVGPEQGFNVLKEFLDQAQTKLTCAMYQFYVTHIEQLIDARLRDGVAMKLVADPKTRNTSPSPDAGEFDRSQQFKEWREQRTFDNIYVPRSGAKKLVSTSYHIKVAVRDDNTVWLSSGNWTKNSQPNVDATGKAGAGNREWHIVIANRKLATMFQSHILADFAQCQELGATTEALEAPPIMIDVPIELSGMLTEAPVELLAPLEIGPRKVKVRPILTPDRGGRVFTDAMLNLIRSARDQLLFQIPYITISQGMAGNLGELVDALVERSRTIGDFRLILGSGSGRDAIPELRRRGMDVVRCIRLRSATHTKGMVVDGQRVMIGSQNWSQDGVTVNRDASLLFDDAEVADYFRKAFLIDWARASSVSAAVPERPVLPASGAEPPPGYRRMTLDEYRNG